MINTYDFYHKNLEKHGPNWKGMGWRTQHDQLKRFEILSEIGDLTNKRILEIGCGVADFYGYLLHRGTPTRYTGYDLLLEMTDYAHKKYPEASFATGDVTVVGFGYGEKWDYVFCCGTFNIDLGNNVEVMKGVIRNMYQVSTKGIAISFLSNDDPEPHDPNFFYYDPASMLEYCRSITTHVYMEYGHLPDDFIIHMYHPAP